MFVTPSQLAALRNSKPVLRFAATLAEVKLGKPQQTELDAFLRNTAFPNTRETLVRMEAHAKDALQKAQDQTGMKVLYSGYDGDCSMATGSVLPGSDLDHWVVLLKGKPTQTSADFRQALVTALAEKPDLADPDIQEHLFDSSMMTLPELLKRLKQPTPEKMNTWVDRFPRFLDIFTTGKTLIHQLPGKLNEWLQQNKWVQKIRQIVPPPEFKTQWPVKAKHLARQKLLTQFPQLSAAEQYLVMKILKSQNAGAAQLPVLSSNTPRKHLNPLVEDLQNIRQYVQQEMKSASDPQEKQLDLLLKFQSMTREDGLLTCKTKDITQEDLQDAMVFFMPEPEGTPKIEVFQLKPKYRGTEPPLFETPEAHQAVIDSLLQKGLLQRIDPKETPVQEAIAAIKDKQNWLTKMYLDHFKAPKLVPPWKPFHCDEPILTHLQHPELEAAWDTLKQGSYPEDWFPIFERARPKPKK